LLAKDVLVLVLVHELGVAASTAEGALKTAEPYHIGIGIVRHYATLGFVMPLFICRRMIDIIKLWFTENTRENFLVQMPSIVISEDTWIGIVKVMKAWIEPETHYTPSFPSVTATLSAYTPCGEDIKKEMMAGLADMGAGHDKILDSAKDRKRAEVQQAFENMELSISSRRRCN
jgi:hypothetical protein